MDSSIAELYDMPRHDLLPRALVLSSIAFIGCMFWDRKHATVTRPVPFKGRLDAGFSAGVSAAVAIAIVMGLAVDMPRMPLIERRVGSLWEIADFLVSGLAHGLYAAVTIGLASALVASALAATLQRFWTPARGLVVGLAISIPGSAALADSYFWCGNWLPAQRTLGIAMLTTAGVVAGMAAGVFASRGGDDAVRPAEGGVVT